MKYFTFRVNVSNVEKFKEIYNRNVIKKMDINDIINIITWYKIMYYVYIFVEDKFNILEISSEFEFPPFKFQKKISKAKAFPSATCSSENGFIIAARMSPDFANEKHVNFVCTLPKFHDCS